MCRSVVFMRCSPWQPTIAGVMTAQAHTMHHQVSNSARPCPLHLVVCSDTMSPSAAQAAEKAEGIPSDCRCKDSIPQIACPAFERGNCLAAVHAALQPMAAGFTGTRRATHVSSWMGCDTRAPPLSFKFGETGAHGGLAGTHSSSPLVVQPEHVDLPEGGNPHARPPQIFPGPFLGPAACCLLSRASLGLDPGSW
jgi:hypothetical protein